MCAYSTSQIAKKAGIHANTVRLYEELGFIPKAARAKNGYRLFGDRHLEHVLMVRTAFRSTWLGGGIREKALSVLRLSAAGMWEEAGKAASEHLELVRAEKEKAELAAKYLEQWAAEYDDKNPPSALLTAHETAALLDITQDMLRSWERNGLLTVPRNPANGYRQYTGTEIRRLYIIRALRKARFSLMSIYHMLRRFDDGRRMRLSEVLNELPPGEADIFYSTDQWLIKISEIERAARELIERLHRAARI